MNSLPPGPRAARGSSLDSARSRSPSPRSLIFANKLTFPADDRVILTAVIALLAAALFAAWRRQALTSTQARVLLVLLLLFELGNSGQYNLADRSDRNQMQWLDQMRANDDIGEYLRKQPGFQRTEIAGGAFQPNWGDLHGVEMHGGIGAQRHHQRAAIGSSSA